LYKTIICLHSHILYLLFYSSVNFTEDLAECVSIFDFDGHGDSEGGGQGKGGGLDRVVGWVGQNLSVNWSDADVEIKVYVCMCVWVGLLVCGCVGTPKTKPLFTLFCFLRVIIER
jgi:hypothetical protein